MTLSLIAALFLPLFPLSIALNAALMRLRAPVARAALLLVWPQLGAALLAALPAVPDVFAAWALSSAAFYALRLLTVRDLGLWAGFSACSALALTWNLAAAGAGAAELHLFAFWFSLPAALLALLTGPIARRLGAAYAGLHGGLAGQLPRLSGVLVALVLAAVATPPFPGFFAMLYLLTGLGALAALGVLAVWLVWGWAATRLMQGFVTGSGAPAAGGDLARSGALAYAAALGVFAAAGLYLTGGGL